MDAHTQDKPTLADWLNHFGPKADRSLPNSSADVGVPVQLNGCAAQVRVDIENVTELLSSFDGLDQPWAGPELSEAHEQFHQMHDVLYAIQNVIVDGLVGLMQSAAPLTGWPQIGDSLFYYFQTDLDEMPATYTITGRTFSNHSNAQSLEISYKVTAEVG